MRENGREKACKISDFRANEELPFQIGEEELYNGGKFLPDILAYTQHCPDGGVAPEPRMSQLWLHKPTLISRLPCALLSAFSAAAGG